LVSIGDFDQLPPVKPSIPVYQHIHVGDNAHADDYAGYAMWLEPRYANDEVEPILQQMRNGPLDETARAKLNSRTIDAHNVPPVGLLTVFHSNHEVAQMNFVTTHRVAKHRGLDVIRLPARIHTKRTTDGSAQMVPHSHPAYNG
jgi:hypothetical protein